MLYEPEVSESELDAFGFSPSDYADEEFGVWPDNWQAFTLFSKMGTQWRRAGQGGHVTGLDYAAVNAVFDIHQIKRKERARLLDQIGVMELEAIVVINESAG